MRTNNVLMIRPVSFAFNEETALSNTFQNKLDVSLDSIQSEFDHSVKVLEEAGVNVKVVDDTKSPPKPDAVFPNNWIQMRQDGKVVLFPMKTPNRRAERRLDIVEALSEEFNVLETLDLSFHEDSNRILEGTGSLVFDHYQKVGYACVSPRTNAELARDYIKSIGYAPVLFEANYSGSQIYHTNVVMAVKEDLIVACLEVMDEVGQEYFRSLDRKILEISADQMNQFAGNMLEVADKNGNSLLVMSKVAYNSLNQAQIRALEESSTICVLPLDLIEAVGGGSARCMIAENFLPKK